MRIRVLGKTVGQWLLLSGLGVVLYFCFRIMQPFLLPAFLALILSILLSPVFHTLKQRLGGRRTAASVLVCLGLTLLILLPIIFLSLSLANEANDAYQRIKDPETLHKIENWIDPDTNPMFLRIREWLPDSFRLEGLQLGSQAQRVGVALLAGAMAFAAGIFNFVMDYVIVIVVLFFLLRDSDDFAERLQTISPLSHEQQNVFLERLRTVTRATVLGNFLTALSQGTISGLTFLAVGLPNPILFGALTALLSLIPFVGTALVWVPWTIYLFAVGSPVKAVVFLLIQVLVIGSVDNVLRPLFMRGGAKMHTLLIFFSVLGGISYFGILGMFFGPLMFGIAIALLEIYVLPQRRLIETPE